MKVSLEITPECIEPYAVVYADHVTSEVQRVMDLFGNSNGTIPIVAQNQNEMIIMQPKDIFMVRVEDGQTVIYGQKEKYFSRKRLYELKEQLGGKFMQISKAALINLNCMDSVESGFGGTLLLKLKNGCKEYVSRKYLPEFKKYLGL